MHEYLNVYATTDKVEDDWRKIELKHNNQGLC